VPLGRSDGLDSLSAHEPDELRQSLMTRATDPLSRIPKFATNRIRFLVRNPWFVLRKSDYAEVNDKTSGRFVPPHFVVFLHVGFHEHAMYMSSLFKSGPVVLGGPFTGEPPSQNVSGAMLISQATRPGTRAVLPRQQ
jgi:hypothetical protein